MEQRKNIYPQVAEALKKGGAFALATIVEAHGSTPQIPGASAFFSRRGLLFGTLGGGLVEAEAQKKALEGLRKGFSLVYESSLAGDVSSEEALCGGRLRVLIDSTPARSRKAFERLGQSLLSRRAGVLVTRIVEKEDGRAVIERKWWGEPEISQGWPEKFPRPEELKEVQEKGEPRLVSIRGKGNSRRGRRDFFLEPFFPRPRLVIVGAGHVGQAVARLGHWLDFEVTVIDDRPEMASRERFPAADFLVVDEIEPALRTFPVDADTYVVIVTRGHRHDAEALRATIRSPARYVGMIGSSRKVSLMRREFLEKGWATPAEFDRVHAPIGLEIGSRTVEEIAVSIAAELVLVRSVEAKKIKGGRR